MRKERRAKEEKVSRREERDIEERRKKEERTREGLGERRRRNVVWRGVEGKEPEERREVMVEVMEEVLGRRVKMRGVVERIGEGEKRY